MTPPTYIRGVGALATSRYDFQNHLDGVNPPGFTDFRHTAGEIDIIPSIVIDGYQYTTVLAALDALAALVLGGSFTPGGDLAGDSASQEVIGLYNHPLASTVPVQSAVPVYDTSVLRYDVRPLTMDDILAGFTINSFSGGSTVEVGVAVINPSFVASYSSLPASATITNTDNIDSPLTLTTPYTSGTVIGSFTHSTLTSVTFTLTAISTSTQTAVQYITYAGRDFGGVGTPGATSATASGTSALLNASHGTLTNQGLYFGNEVGASFGPFSPSGQAIYLLLQGNNHTFKDQNGFTFAMNTSTNFSFTNQNGIVLSMYLYQSTNTLSTPFTITVVS
jgi:hypothetical protein